MSNKRQRLHEAAAAILRHAPNGRMGRVCLNKSLFYFDLTSLLEEGEVFTNQSFIALQMGPVVSGYEKRLVSSMISAGYAEEVSKGMGRPMVLTADPERIHMTDALEERAAGVAQKFGNMSAQEASDYSHENIGWQIAWEAGQMAGRNQKIAMQLAMQQILDDDDWLNMPIEPIHVDRVMHQLKNNTNTKEWV